MCTVPFELIYSWTQKCAEVSFKEGWFWPNLNKAPLLFVYTLNASNAVWKEVRYVYVYISSISSGQSRICRVCGSSPSTNLDLPCHMGVRHRSLLYPCATCGRSFNRKQKLLCHVEVKHWCLSVFSLLNIYFVVDVVTYF